MYAALVSSVRFNSPCLLGEYGISKAITYVHGTYYLTFNCDIFINSRCHINKYLSIYMCRYVHVGNALYRALIIYQGGH